MFCTGGIVVLLYLSTGALCYGFNSVTALFFVALSLAELRGF